MKRMRGRVEDHDHAVELEREAHPALQQGGDLEAVLERATHELREEELEVATLQAVDESERAADREVGHWVMALVLGAVLAAAAVADWRVALAALALGLLYILPIVLAGASTAKRETARQTFTHAIHAHDDRLAQARQEHEAEIRREELHRAAGLEGQPGPPPPVV